MSYLHTGQITLVNGINHDVDPGVYDFVRVFGPTADYQIDSILARPAQPRIAIYVGANNAYSATFVHGVNVPPPNKIVCPGFASLVVKQNNSIVELLYDTVVSCWRPVFHV